LSLFTYLSADGSHKLSEDMEQDKNGDTIADISRHSSVYIKEQTDVSAYSKCGNYKWKYSISFVNSGSCFSHHECKHGFKLSACPQLAYSSLVT